MTVRKPKYCCKKFESYFEFGILYKGKTKWWIYTEQLGDVDINNCPWCGKNLHAPKTLPKNTNTLTYDGRVIHE